MPTKAVQIKWAEDRRARERSFPRQCQALLEMAEEFALRCEACSRRLFDFFFPRTGVTRDTHQEENAQPIMDIDEEYEQLNKEYKQLTTEYAQLTKKVDKFKPEISHMESKQLGKFSVKKLMLLQELSKFSITELMISQKRMQRSLEILKRIEWEAF